MEPNNTPTPNTGTEELGLREYGNCTNKQFTADTGYDCGIFYWKTDVEKLLTTQKSQIIAEVESMREPNQGVSEYYSGFNTALDKVKVKLESFNTKLKGV